MLTINSLFIITGISVANVDFAALLSYEGLFLKIGDFTRLFTFRSYLRFGIFDIICSGIILQLIRLVEMSYFRYEDKQIYYEESGEGSPLVLLHGNTSCGKMFDPIVPVFAAKYRVIVPDFLGNGRSERIEKWPSDLWFDWAKQVKALCNHLGLKKVKLIGSSGGALAAINVALEYPELVESFIADSFEGLKADHEITEQIRNGRAQAKTFGGFVDYLKTLHGDDWEQVFDADTDAVLRHAEQIGEFLHKPIDELKVPMLLTGSLEDDMFPKDHCKVLFDEICAKTSLAKAHIFEHGGHPAMLSNMDEFVDLIYRISEEYEWINRYSLITLIEYIQLLWV